MYVLGSNVMYYLMCICMLYMSFKPLKLLTTYMAFIRKKERKEKDTNVLLNWSKSSVEYQNIPVPTLALLKKSHMKK